MEISETGITSSAGELANMLGLTVTRVQQLSNDGVITTLERGVYDVTSSVRGYCEWIRGKSRGSDTSKEEKQERIRLTKARASVAELNHSELVGSLVRADVVHMQDFKIGRILRNNLQSIPDRISAILAAETEEEKIYAMIDTEIRNSLDEVINAMNSETTEPASLVDSGDGQ